MVLTVSTETMDWALTVLPGISPRRREKARMQPVGAAQTLRVGEMSAACVSLPVGGERCPAGQ
ncbi:hypothetical protein BC361_09540 [Ensifer sp. LC54]|nr:hypothetical protein BC361_09540 [Ensifer sp. LC54]OCP28426.1 hypothetical protein BC363_00820 [Ensifer sp. LC384]